MVEKERRMGKGGQCAPFSHKIDESGSNVQNCDYG